jgi:hypothetical protein
MRAKIEHREFITLLGGAAAFNQPSALVLSVVLVCTISSKADESYGVPPPSMATHLDQLVRSYPDWIAGCDETDLILKRGNQRLAISDGRTNKSFEGMQRRHTAMRLPARLRWRLLQRAGGGSNRAGTPGAPMCF